ncbi:hypothetical protein KIN20_005134 [Parelaphostrongylus tenuis]|uniref:Uncharacterized protein n=1 Tax=Parelaphostrongylus tenuis TaxID=148309 RepID=A0AAD5MSC6_PARTN|nr:hypothetical protein KIN20_005134 [Parelaphostrongylus tenuis]
MFRTASNVCTAKEHNIESLSFAKKIAISIGYDRQTLNGAVATSLSSLRAIVAATGGQGHRCRTETMVAPPTSARRLSVSCCAGVLVGRVPPCPYSAASLAYGSPPLL